MPIEIMKFEEYQNEAKQTALYPNRLKNLEYPTLGLTGEAGEVANIVKENPTRFRRRNYRRNSRETKRRAWRRSLVHFCLCR